MIKIVIDTNILVSALLTPTGNAAQIIDRVFSEELLPIYYSSILLEYATVLARPRFAFSSDDQNHLINGIVKYGESIIPEISNIIFVDESDRIFFDTAKSSDAYLVTGNQRHFPDELFVVTPADCIMLLDML